ncbi:uncharacterized protein LOC119741852 isoform X1 [Patiria miniata]|uniref:Uncharacterized protein n=1 Tax=Patiria miniata TaxID=46514 RepID=A0A914BE37_PATMI|nr:uncharacterized protein LOC119741852 isoform X1 [Patiria miniata]
MVPFLMQLVVFVALCSFSKAIESKCKDYYDGIAHHVGLSCPLEPSSNAIYCCESTKGHLQSCCIETEWLNQRPNSGLDKSIDDSITPVYLSPYLYLSVPVALILVGLIVGIASKVVRCKTCAANTNSTIATTCTVLEVTGPTCTHGPYQLIDNPPSYPVTPSTRLGRPQLEYNASK